MNRELLNMNHGWRFHDGEVDLRNIGSVHNQFKHPEWVKAANNGLAFATYDDSEWEEVVLPHDFVIERGVYDGSLLSCTGSLEKGVVWYRKTFEIPKEDEGKRLFIQFDGVYRDSEVWLNGCLIGRHLGGYMGFEYEVTEAIKYGAQNTIAVHVDASEYEGWWYEGGGIYRDVRLMKTEKVRFVDKELHVKQMSVDLQEKEAVLRVEGLIDAGDITELSVAIQLALIDPDGNVVANECTETSLNTYGQGSYTFDFIVNDVALWDLNNPNLYSVKVSFKEDGIEDSASKRFGIRTIKYSVDKGFELNDETVKLKGVCGHDDFAGVGTALTRPIIAYKIDRLKSMGCNAYRCAHNPPDPKFLELCDTMGMLVMDETRMPGIDQDNMTDYIDLIKRDRNHPSVICWSMGNEEMALQMTEIGVKIIQKMQTIGQLYDDSKPFMYALNNDYSNIIDWDRERNLICNPMGVNYFSETNGRDVYNDIHERYPDLVMINTETTGICTSRAYCLPEDDTKLTSESTSRITAWDDEQFMDKVTCYGSSRPVWGVRPDVSWKYHADKAYSAGVFLWTGFDYRGEVFPFDYPATTSFYGIIDLCGFEKDWFYYMQSQWTDKNVLHLLPHWNMNVAEGTQVKVWAFTNAQEVELSLNGVSHGKKTCEKHGYVEWLLPYEKGTLSAIGYEGGSVVSRDEKVTAGEPVKLVLKADKAFMKADADDVVFVTAHLEDSDGNFVYNTGEEIEFTHQGPCEFIGTGNGNNLSSEHDKEEKRTLFVGKCMAMYRSTFEAGELTITGSWCDQVSSLTINSDASEYMEIVESVGYDGEVDQRQKSKADGGF